MHITDYLRLENVLIDLTSPSKRAVLQTLSARAAATSNIDATAILAALEGREMLGSTGVGHGIAIPHATLAGLGSPLAVLATLNRPLEYDAIDEEPVDIVFLLLIPADDRAVGLKALAAAARLLRVSTFATQMRQATSSNAVYAAIAALEGE